MTNEAVRPKLNTPEIQTQGPAGGIILNIQRENKPNRLGSQLWQKSKYLIILNQNFSSSDNRCKNLVQTFVLFEDLKKDVWVTETLIKYLLVSFLEVFNFECKYFV